MIKDIPELLVEDIAIAIVMEENEVGETIWNSYFINYKKEKIETVLVTSTGYGVISNEKVSTSTLRHFLDTIDAFSFMQIEPIVQEVFGINNEYWVSFYHNKHLYDKKFIFLAESIKVDNLINIPLLNKKGVMIK